MAASEFAGEALDPRRARQLAAGFGVLVGLTFCLIVLGALVRAHEAGLACPDWPLCFGEFVPTMDLQVAFEWSHRVAAGSISLVFAALAIAAWRAGSPRDTRRLLAAAAVLLGIQVMLGALTVWELLASWTVTSHLVVGNAFALTLLLVACSLQDRARGGFRSQPIPASTRASVSVGALLLLAQVVLGGLVSSRFAGMACPEWPTCNGGVWFPSWQGSVGLHVVHRLNGYALWAALAVAAIAAWRHPRLRAPSLLALAIASLQVLVGVANVLLGIPVEVTGLHSALAAALVLATTLSMREAWRPAAA